MSALLAWSALCAWLPGATGALGVMGAPGVTGSDESWRDELLARIAAFPTEAPGGGVAVIRDGEVVLLEPFGMADLERDETMTGDTPVYIASVAKSFTAACALQAHRDGTLDLDASILEHFEELPKGWRGITLRDCLHHRSGIADLYDVAIGSDAGSAPFVSNARAMEWIARFPAPAFEPGARFVYSNTGYVLLAEAIERASETDFAEFAREHLFAPAGMDASGFTGGATAAGTARAYGRSGNDWSAIEIVSGMRGPGGMVASLRDLATWASAPLHADQVRLPAGPPHPRLGGYAGGWMLTRIDGRLAVRHFGGAFGYSADILRFPADETDPGSADGVVIVALSNDAGRNAAELSVDAARVVLGGPLSSGRSGPSAVALTSEQRARFGRFWIDPETDAVWVLSSRGDRFLFNGFADVRVELVPVSPTRLELAEAQLTSFALELEDESLWLLHGETERALEPLPFPPLEPVRASEYVGEYESASLGARVHLELRGGRLALRQERPLLTLPPFHGIAPDLFLCDAGAMLRFDRASDGRVAGFTLDTNRAFGLVFDAVEEGQ